MINLIKNELFKIIHKPGLYILLAFSLSSIVLNCFIASYDDYGSVGMIYYYEGLEENLKDYDLSDAAELNYYIGDKTIVEAYKLYKDYAYDSPEYYFVENDVTANIQCMNEALYRDKDEYKYNECKAVYDKQVLLLNNFDWKNVINERIKENDNLIDEYKAAKNGDTLNDSELDNQINYLEEENKIYEYRIENNVPLSYSTVSNELDNYLNSYQEFQTLELDESKYKNRGDLERKREIESTYFTTKYMLEHDMLLKEENDYMASNFVYIFITLDIFLLIAAIMIAGSIVSDEFSKGTIKQLLLKPFTRNDILTSKIVASVVAFFGFTVVYTLLNVLVSSIFFQGFSSFLDPIIVYDFSKSAVVEYGVFEYSMLHFVSLLPAYFILMLFTLFIGILTTNTTGAIVSGFVLFGLSSLIFDLTLTESMIFLPFIHWDFTSYLFGGLHWFKYTTFGISVFIVTIYIVVLLVLSYILFNFKDIKNQ